MNFRGESIAYKVSSQVFEDANGLEFAPGNTN